jgi:hypothetical protein
MRESINFSDAPAMFDDTVGSGSIFHDPQRPWIPGNALKSC